MFSKKERISDLSAKAVWPLKAEILKQKSGGQKSGGRNLKEKFRGENLEREGD